MGTLGRNLYSTYKCTREEKKMGRGATEKGRKIQTNIFDRFCYVKIVFWLMRDSQITFNF